jgi:YfiH family protein
MEPFKLKNKSFYIIDSWEKQFPGLTAGMTTKMGGQSKGDFEELNVGFHVGDCLKDVCVNREKLAILLDFPLNSWVGAEQTHGHTIQKVSKKDCGKGADNYDSSFKATDGFFTNQNGILLTLCFADCVPLYFIAPERKMIGVAHAGWKGTVNEIARKMVNAWEVEGIAPEEIYVTIGPSICGKCYIVDDKVINFVENILEDGEEKPYNLIKEGQYALDLREVNRKILNSAGIPEKNIAVTELCSSCDEEFFSHRRDHGRTGRMVSFIGWKEIADRL